MHWFFIIDLSTRFILIWVLKKQSYYLEGTVQGGEGRVLVALALLEGNKALEGRMKGREG